MKLSILEWNIGGAAAFPWGNNEIKPWIIKEILNELPDIIVLTEFVVSKGWDILQDSLKASGYYWFISNSTGKNGILIAIKKHDDFIFSRILKYDDGTINTSEVLCGIDVPDFYEVIVDINNSPLSIIGIRIRKDINQNSKKYTAAQFKLLDSYLSSLNHKVICIGDFNAYWAGKWKTSNNYTLPKTSMNYSLHTPPYNVKEGFSYVQPNGTKVQLDHLITNLPINSSIIKYDWGFLCNNNGYQNYTKESSLALLKLPDHAILKCTIEW